MDLDPYLHITRQIVSYPEFRVTAEIFRGFLLIVVGLLLLLSLFHNLYYLGQRTPLYRRKPPVDGWHRRFYSMLIFLAVTLLILVWAIRLLLDHTVSTH